jgi:putative restriction endonuclease
LNLDNKRWVHQMKGFIGITDNEWFAFLSQQPGIDEVNFWQPGGQTQFRSLNPGEPFFFRLHSPHNFIVGGGFFAHSTILPVSLAWSAFDIKNGAGSLAVMRLRTEIYRKYKPSPFEDYKIGCILPIQTFFCKQQDRIRAPAEAGKTSGP